MKKLALFLISFIFFSQISFWYSKTDLSLFYSKLYSQVEIKAKNDKSITKQYLEKIDIILNKALNKTKKQKNKEVFQELISLNNKALLKLILDKENNSLNNTQKPNNPSYINSLTSNWYKFLNTNSNLEFVENNITYKITFKKYYEVDLSNYKYFLNNKINNWIILLFNWNYIITNDYFSQQKYNNLNIYKEFNNFLDLENPYFIENSYYYTYKYSNYIFFENNNSLYKQDLIQNWIDPKTTLLIKDFDKYYFAKKYDKIKLVSTNTIENITNKKEFLYNLADDNKYIIWDYENILKDIKKDTLNIVLQAKNQDEKIKLIYDFVINKVKYNFDYKNWNKEVFSWVLTYKNNSWVCDWYVKLFLYMLSFAWVNDVEIKRWFAFDSADFPNYWHAWIKIWDYYYDPTFEDTIKTWDETLYYYYKLPKEVMYVDRFDWLSIPNHLKNLSLDKRKELVLKNMYEIYQDNRNYKILNKVKNKIFLWLNYDEKITLNSLINKIWISEVRTWSFYYNSMKFDIKSLWFYVLNDENIDFILSNTFIDLDQDIYLLKWYKSDWSFEYRLAYDVIFY